MEVSKTCGVVLAAAAIAALGGCATESSRSLPVAPVASAQRPPVGKAVQISVGKFDNRSSYMRGIFSDGVDRLGSRPRPF